MEPQLDELELSLRANDSGKCNSISACKIVSTNQ